MGHIIAGKAYANKVALIAWSIDALIPHCLGFELTRIYVDNNEERVLPARVPFKGQRNPDWKEQTTSVWPVQKLFWRDLTARKRRDAMTRRPADVRVKYRVRPLVPPGPGLTPVTNIPPKTYEGAPVSLAYAGEGFVTNEVLITAKYGDVRATFTNGILSAQWPVRADQQRDDRRVAGAGAEVRPVLGPAPRGHQALHASQPADRGNEQRAGTADPPGR